MSAVRAPRLVDGDVAARGLAGRRTSWCGRRRPGRCSATSASRSTPSSPTPWSAARRRGATSSSRSSARARRRRHRARARARRAALPRARSTTSRCPRGSTPAYVVGGRLRHRRRRHRPRAPGARLRRGRPRSSAGVRPPDAQPGRARRAVHRRGALARGRRRCATANDARSSTSSSARGAAGATLDYTHSVPHCWRCGDGPHLLGQAELVRRDEHAQGRPGRARTRRIDWHPEHIRDGRFGEWLENNVDWALSRDRYWGTPLPVWRCERRAPHLRRLARRALRRSPGATCRRSTRTARRSTRSTFAVPRVRRDRRAASRR